jgi:hypothetical protein
VKKENRVCAYCGSVTDLSNEHLFPKFLHERSQGSMISVARTAVGDKAVGGELKIGDVCMRCNNGPLASLDNYVCNLHDRFYRAIVHSGDRVDFRFEFERLLRWLLKTAFNIARARGGAIESSTDLANYILNGTKRPKGFRVFLQLIIPTPTSSREWLNMPNVPEIPPAPARVDFLDVRILVGFNIAFILSQNSYLFHVFKEDYRMPRSVRTPIWKNLLKNKPGAYEITDKHRAIVYSSSLDFMTFVEGNSVFARHLEMMKQHNDQIKQSKKKAPNIGAKVDKP